MSRNIGILTAQQRQAARLHIRGYSHTDIAKQFGIHRATVCRWLKSEALQHEVQRLQEIADQTVLEPASHSVREKLIEASKAAVDFLTVLLEDERQDPEIMKLKANAATEVLSRTGFSPIKQVEVRQQSISTQIGASEIAQLKARAQAVQIPDACDDVVDLINDGKDS